jgi:hypothetical protein
MRALARRIPAHELGVFAIDPWFMPGTALARDLPWHLRFAWHVVLPLLVPVTRGTSTPRRSGNAIAWIATDPSLASTSGVYFDYRQRAHRLTPAMGNDQFAEDLFATSLALCGLPAM